MTVRVVIADDHEMFRQGLAALLEKRGDGVEVCGQAVDGDEALELVEMLAPDLAILDQTMPGKRGVEVLREIRRRNNPTQCLILTMHTDARLAQIAMEAGARGFVVKESAFDELLDAVDEVLSGGLFVSPSVAEQMDEEVAPRTPGEAELTAREREVLVHIARGLTNREMAGTLGISLKTVDTHRTRLMQKLDLHSATALTRFAIRIGLIQP